MDIFLSATPSGLSGVLSAITSSRVFGIIFAIFAFGVLIMVHELGHFIAAKKAGVKVNEFSIGMGPAIFKRVKGDTTYALRALPIGGYVAMEGETDDSDDDRSYKKTSKPKRAIIMLAGATMNILLGLILMIGITFYQASKPDFMFPTTIIGQFYETAVTNEQLMVDDKVIEINGRRVRNHSDMTYYMTRDRDEYMDILVVRNGAEQLLEKVEFDREEIAEGISINALDFMTYGVPPTFGLTLQQSFVRTYTLMRQIWSSLGDLVTGNISVNHMSGPIGITKQVGEITSSGNWMTTVLLVAMISLNLGMFNLLPFPALDGGQLALLLLEKIRGKALDEKYEIYITLIGFALLFGLMIYVSISDVSKIIRGA